MAGEGDENLTVRDARPGFCPAAEAPETEET